MVQALLEKAGEKLEKVEGPTREEQTPVGDADRRPDLRVSAPAPDAGQQPGFKVVEETPRTANNKLIWTAVILVVAILAGYVLGYLR